MCDLRAESFTGLLHSYTRGGRSIDTIHTEADTFFGMLHVTSYYVLSNRCLAYCYDAHTSFLYVIIVPRIYVVSVARRTRHRRRRVGVTRVYVAHHSALGVSGGLVGGGGGSPK